MRPSEELSWPAGSPGRGGPDHGRILPHIEPSWKNGSSGLHRNQDPYVEARTTRVEALEVVDGGKAGFGDMVPIGISYIEMKRTCGILQKDFILPQEVSM